MNPPELVTSNRSLTSYVKHYLRTRLNNEQIKSLKRFQALRFRKTQGILWRLLCGRNLNLLATIYNTDKWNDHWYTQHYHRHFGDRRTRRLNIIEIGIGGYDDPEMGGASLRMWRTYFPNSMVHGIDIFDKKPHEERRIRTHQGSQTDANFLASVLNEVGQLDIVIDDGSHINEHVIASFRYLFPKLVPGGLYVIEDTQTSYWQAYGGSSSDFDRKDTSMGFLKSVTDSINSMEFEIPGSSATEYDSQIVAMHFYHNIVFIEKRAGPEPPTSKHR
jgi:hypothetical protein